MGHPAYVHQIEDITTSNSSSSSSSSIAGIQFEIKIKRLRQAQEWPSSSHREWIGKTLSFTGIRSNKKTHINCGSPARIAGIVRANEDQMRRQG
ncbi:hypothetical protein [Absidia glauca]|uniref:Ndc10 domain-containing protein n=1 Tax=Absidia glauca TaxID=4829 RepID=A0A168MT67_ABSGL|nr:hypothetical protein [Absidia glauca]